MRKPLAEFKITINDDDTYNSKILPDEIDEDLSGTIIAVCLQQFATDAYDAGMTKEKTLESLTDFVKDAVDYVYGNGGLLS